MSFNRVIVRSLEALNDIASQFGSSWNPNVARAYDMPQILPGEAISSWLIRYAIRRDCSPTKIFELIGCRWNRPLFWLDFDIKALPWDYLGRLTSCPPGSLKQRIPNHAQLLLSPEFLCLHVNPMRMTPHLRFCAKCLASDPIPYFRSTWRLASTWICSKHGSVMRDYCPNCRTPLFWSFGSRKRINISNICACYHCQGDLRTCKDSNELPHWLTSELTVIQTEFSYLLGFQSNELHFAEADSIDTDGNTSEREATRAMQASLRDAYSRRDTSCLAESQQRLREITRILDFSPIAETPGPFIGVGIEAKSIFGRAAGQICSVMMSHQDLFGTTLWWPGENLLKNARREIWKPEDFNRTKLWVLRYSTPLATPGIEIRS